MTNRTVDIIYMMHDGGSKDYHYITLKDHDKDQAEVYVRWGKTGAGGQAKSDSISDIVSIKHHINRAMRKRMDRGYGVIQTASFNSLDEIMQYDGPGMVAINRNDRLCKTIFNFMKDTFGASDIESDPVSKPAPEIERGELWGSW